MRMVSFSSLVGRIGWPLVVALGVAGCGGGGPAPADPAPAPGPEPTLRFALTAAQPSPAAAATSIEGRLDDSSQRGDLDFRYDAYVVTAVRSGPVGVTSTVVEGKYAYGYGFPISLGLIQNSADLRAHGGNYEQDALNTGVAVTRYTVEEGQQYILVYKTFGSFTPLRYTLLVGEGLRVEGRIARDPATGALPADPGGLISLGNPRPRALSQVMEQIGPVVQSTR
jgi:hypothetical protein